MAVFFLLPWLNWDGRQAILFDLPERHFYIFWWTFLPRDFFFLSWILIIAAFALFAATVFAGSPTAHREAETAKAHRG